MKRRPKGELGSSTAPVQDTRVGRAGGARLDGEAPSWQGHISGLTRWPGGYSDTSVVNPSLFQKEHIANREQIVYIADLKSIPIARQGPRCRGVESPP